MQVNRRAFFEASYDGVTYRQVYRLDPRLVVPGALLLVLVAPGATALTWPDARPGLVIAGIAAGLIALGLARRMRFEASPEGYRLGWRIGPIGWTVHLPGEGTTPYAVRGRHGVHRMMLRRGWRRRQPLIQAGNARQGEAWARFLDAVTRGEPGIWPAAPGANPAARRKAGNNDLPWEVDESAGDDDRLL